MRIAAGAGALLTVLMWTAVLPPASNPVMDDHLIYAAVLIVLALLGAGTTLGIGRRWAATPLARRNTWLTWVRPAYAGREPRDRPAHAVPPFVSQKPTEENDMSEPVYVDKAKVIAELRSRQLHARADWIDRELPGLIDTYKNSSLLQMLGIDPDAMEPADVVASRS